MLLQPVLYVLRIHLRNAGWSNFWMLLSPTGDGLEVGPWRRRPGLGVELDRIGYPPGLQACARGSLCASFVERGFDGHFCAPISGDRFGGLRALHGAMESPPGG